MLNENLIFRIKNMTLPQLINYNKNLNSIDSIINKIGIPDVSILGFGADGHTASIFPNSCNSYLNKSNLIIIENDWEEFKRISLSFNFILKSKKIFFLLNGKDKASALKDCLSIKYDPYLYPTQYLLKNFPNEISIYCDKDSASML